LLKLQPLSPIPLIPGALSFYPAGGFSSPDHLPVSSTNFITLPVPLEADVKPLKSSYIAYATAHSFGQEQMAYRCDHAYTPQARSLADDDDQPVCAIIVLKEMIIIQLMAMLRRFINVIDASTGICGTL